MEGRGRATVWDTRTWAQRSTFEIPPNACSVDFSPDGRALVFGHFEGKVTWWDWAKGVKLAEARGHRDRVIGLAFSPDGSKLASTGEDGTVALWDRRTFRLAAKWKGSFIALYGVTFSPDGTRLATGLGGRHVARLWDLKTRRGLLTLTPPGEMFHPVRFSRHGGRLLCAGYLNRCYVWSVPSLAELDAEYTRQNAAR